MVLLKAVVTLSISIVDISGEIEVKKLNTVPFIVSGSTVSLVLDETNTDSDLRNEKIHSRIVSFVWHVRFSCTPGHTDAAFEDAVYRILQYKFTARISQ